MPLKKKFFINCDWLQIHVKHQPCFFENFHYTIKRVGQSKVFRNIYEIRHTVTNVVIAYYSTDASECIMPADEGILKFENKMFYVTGDLKQYIVKVLDYLKLKFIGVTRFDIAFDFETFEKGYEPERFIRDYLTDKITRLNTRTKDADGADCGVFFKQKKDGEKNYQTIMFGSPKSNVSCKLYNKTQELKNSCKPYISKTHGRYFDMSKDIWRLEFSLYSMAAFFKNEMKELAFHSLDILEIDTMYEIFIGLFKKYFRFKRYEPGQRITRMKDIVLWDFDLLDYSELRKIAGNPMVKNSSRSEKIFIKKLHKLNQEFRLFDENFEFTAKELIAKVVDIHQLHEWAHLQNIDYAGAENYIDNIHAYTKIVVDESELMQKDSDIIRRSKMEMEGQQWIKLN